MRNLACVPSLVLALLLAIILITSKNVVSAAQRFIEEPAKYLEVSTGEDVRLRCLVQDKRGQCIWQKDRKPVGIHPDKYEWAGSRDGDCTLLIKRASLDFDDGIWECQVTPGDFTRQDALGSGQARLLVRVKPRIPQLEYGGATLQGPLTLREGQEATISCVSRYGNPPALLKWFIGNEEVEPMREQSNATEVDNPKTWAAHSTIRVRGSRDNHNKAIRCLSIHPTSPQPEVVESRFDIHYFPEVRMETIPRMLATALEDSLSFVSLRCVADANPAASIKWFKDSSPIMVSNGNVMPIGYNRTHQLNATLVESEVRFEPIKREDAGLYSCRAVNVIGESAPANYRLDVQYGPKPRSTDSSIGGLDSKEEQTSLGSNIEPFECPEFDANPSPRYRWLHIRGGSIDKIDNRNHEHAMDGGRRLRLENVGWADEGEYRCEAYNTINGVERKMQSDMRFVLHVIGPPEIQARPSQETEDGMYESIGVTGEAVHRLKSRFCSRPPPRIVAWQWGSSHIRAGESISPKYEALPLEPIIENKVITNCYWAKLDIRDLQHADARMYTLVVESEKGRDSKNLRLVVRDHTEIRMIAAAGAIGLIVLMLLVVLATYALRTRRKHREYRREDEEEGSVSTTTIERNGQLKAALASQPQPQQQQQQQQHMSQQQHIQHQYHHQLPQQHQQYQQNTLKSIMVGGGMVGGIGGSGSLIGGVGGYPRKPSVCSSSIADDGLAVMYDYDQIACKSRQAMSPEALKVRRAPAVLQPPTIV